MPSQEASAILLYKNKNQYIFTNCGQSSVEGFMEKLQTAQSKLASIQPLTVYTGFHGDEVGNFHEAFSAAEERLVRTAAKNFPNVTIKYQATDMTDADIEAALKIGNVFFTWCDSDTRVRRVLGNTTDPNLRMILEAEYKPA